jgi:hypothetical protein
MRLKSIPPLPHVTGTISLGNVVMVCILLYIARSVNATGFKAKSMDRCMQRVRRGRLKEGQSFQSSRSCLRISIVAQRKILLYRGRDNKVYFFAGLIQPWKAPVGLSPTSLMKLGKHPDFSKAEFAQIEAGCVAVPASIVWRESRKPNRSKGQKLIKAENSAFVDE